LVLITGSREELAELATRQDVDQKVDGRVQYGQHVPHGRVIVMPEATLAL